MSRIIVCPTCQSRVSVPDRMASHAVPCPLCKKPLAPDGGAVPTAVPELQFQDDDRPIIRVPHRARQVHFLQRAIVGLVVLLTFGFGIYVLGTVTKGRLAEQNPPPSHETPPPAEKATDRKPPEPVVQKPKQQSPAWEDVLAAAVKHSERIESIGRLEMLAMREARAEEQAVNLVMIGPGGRERAKQAMEYINKSGIESAPDALIEDARKAFPETILRLQTPPGGFTPPTPAVREVIRALPLQLDVATTSEIRSAAKKTPKQLMFQHLAFQDLEKADRPSLAELKRLQSVDLTWYCYARTMAVGRGNSTAVTVVKQWHSNRQGRASGSAKSDGQRVAEAWACCGCLTDEQLAAIQAAVSTKTPLPAQDDFLAVIDLLPKVK